jgi:hypothetical protein
MTAIGLAADDPSRCFATLRLGVFALKSAGLEISEGRDQRSRLYGAGAATSLWAVSSSCSRNTPMLRNF